MDLLTLIPAPKIAYTADIFLGAVYKLTDLTKSLDLLATHKSIAYTVLDRPERPVA